MFKILNVFLIVIMLITISEAQKFFEIILDRLEVIQEDKSVVELNAKVKKVNKTRSIFGSMVYRVPFGNDIKIEIKTLKKQGGEYRYLPYSVPPGPYCDILASDKYIYPDIAKHSDFPEDIKSNCPLSARNYSLNGLSSDFENVPMVAVQTGEYSCECIYYKDNQVVGTYRLYAYVNKV